ncbi:MAG TPA: hypothetical protein VGB46_02670 [Flavisolibacter sp.]|jgi:hypothetical protein
MRKINLILALVLSSFVFVSCQKEFSSEEGNGGGTGTGGGSGTGSGSIIGTWKLLELEARTNSTVTTGTGAGQEKMVTVSHYITKNNTGTMNFDGSKVTQTNISYSVDTTAKAYYYVGGALIDQMEAPFQFSLPSYSSTGTYRQIGSDSLYFDGGSGFMSGTAVQGAPGGMKFRIEGDKLFMTTTASTTQSQVVQGFNVTTTNTVQAEARLQRQ